MWRNEPSNQYFVWYGPYLLFWFLCGILPIWDGAGLLGITVVPSPFFHSLAFGLRFRAWGWFGYWGFRVYGFEMMQSLWMVLSRLSLYIYLFRQYCCFGFNRDLTDEHCLMLKNTTVECYYDGYYSKYKSCAGECNSALYGGTQGQRCRALCPGKYHISIF